MIEIEQTIFEPPHGDCFRACLASILEQPLRAVPNFMEFPVETWFQELQDWLSLRNLIAYHWKLADSDWSPPGYAILGTKSPRGDWDHAVVCKDGKIVWDPSPKRGMGVGEWKDWTVFGVLDPAKPINEVPA